MWLKISRQDIKTNFIKQIEDLSGQQIYACYQCGRCSAGCPVADDTELGPNQVIRLLQLGEKDQALASKMIWYCATCYVCDVRCPKGVDISKIMEALRTVILRKNIDFVKPWEIAREELAKFPPIALVSNFRKQTA